MPDNTPNQNNRILIIDDNRTIHDDFKEILGIPEDAQDGIGDIKDLLFEEEKENLISYEISSAYYVST